MKPPYRVAIMSNAAYSVIHFRLPLIEELVRQGCAVDVLAPTWSAEERARVEALNARCLPYPLDRRSMHPMHHLRVLLALRKLFRENTYDALLTYTAQPNVWGTLAAAWAGIPRRVVMVSGMGFAFTANPDGRYALLRSALRVLMTILFGVAFRQANAVVAQNADDAAWLTHTLGLGAEKVQRIHGTGVPLDQWPMHPPHTQPITFTMVARLLREKGVLEFLAAARQVKSKYPATRFWLLGPLDDNPGALNENDLQPYVQDGTVEWPGSVDVRPWLAQTSVFVLPSYREGVPRSTQEAMAMGRPVITTDAPGCRETVIHGGNGFLVPPRDTQVLAQAMLRFVEEPQWIEPMGRESRRLAEERFDVRRANAVLVRALIPGE
jgi:glycosyltransferase involved in cell wall biosynthesis